MRRSRAGALKVPYGCKLGKVGSPQQVSKTVALLPSLHLHSVERGLSLVRLRNPEASASQLPSIVIAEGLEILALQAEGWPCCKTVCALLLLYCGVAVQEVSSA